MHERECTCLRQMGYYNFVSTCSTCSHNWKCGNERGNFYHFFNLSAAECGHPIHVPDGDWNSNITRFGSIITLTCREGYVINGSATLQCVGRPGWSTYFPVWNDSVPSCQAVGEATISSDWQEGNIRTQLIQNTDNISDDRQTTPKLTTSAMSRATSSLKGSAMHQRLDRLYCTQFLTGSPWIFANDRQITPDLTPSAKSRATCRIVSTSTQETKVIYSLGGLLCVVLAMLVFTWVARCRKMKKHPPDSNKLNVHQNEGPLQMHPIDMSPPTSGTTAHAVLLHTTSADSSSVNQPLSEHPGHLIGNAHRIYQNSTEHYTLETKINTDIDVSGQTDSILQPFRNVFHQDHLEDDRGDDQLQSTADIIQKEHYMDMSGTVKEKLKRNATIIQSREISATAEATDEDGYLLSNVSPRKVTGNKSNTGCSTVNTSDSGRVPFCVNATNSASSIHSSCRALDGCARPGNIQSPMYEEIPSHSDQSTPSQEPRYCPKNSIVNGNEAYLPFSMGLNDPLYSVSIYSSKQNVEPSADVDENGYLVLETADTGEIVGDQSCVSKDTAPTSGTSLYENEVFLETDHHRSFYNPKDRCNSTVYESIPVT
ncbi:uncharacterized protein [Diadema antillarum]|uniref:uncharacterized protein n=1 Tax=Diadema antillarum TaxID=105358 RepID=UPI003A843C4C